MSENSNPNIIEEKVDIGKQSSELEVYDTGSLVKLRHKNNLEQLQVRTLQIISALVIVAILVSTLVILANSNDSASRDWARQTLSALMGFAAGGIWHSQRKRK